MVRDPSVSEDPSDEPNPDQVDDPAQSAPVSAKEPDAAPDGVTSEHGNQPAGATAETVIDQTASKDPKGDVNTATDDQSNKQDTGGETAEAVEAPGTIDATDDSAPASAKASDDASADADDESTEADAPRGRRSSGRNTTSRRRRGRSRRSKSRDNDTTADAEADHGQHIGKDDALEEVPARPRRSRRSYKIQEVVKRRQVLLIQVVKEERGNKGAALTTYLSLAGRYTVLMPNTARGGGISRKITNPQDRKRLKAIANELDVPEGMGLIIRTAGAARTKQEIRRDFEYLLRLWESVRELTLESTAPALVYEEGDLIKRSIRDLYNKDVDQVVVAGDAAYRSAKSFMRMLMPSHAKNVTCYSEPEPLYTRYGIERQLNAMFSPYVHLPSGGYLVINQTEALVAVDVNSGRSTREFSIEETALNTNLEAADEVARQLKLRDLAGLIVIDFIDMEERRNNRNVEKRIRDALHADRARIQVGRISPFGLLEMSRQRLRTGVLEGSTSQCEHCQGTGIIRSVESVALGVLRGLEDTVMAGGRHSLIASTTAEVALYILNNKRDFVIDMEKRLGMPISIESSAKMAGANFTIEKGAAAPAPASARADAVSVDWGFEGDKDEEAGTTARTRDRSNEDGEGDGEERSRPRRRRRRRGGRRNGERGSAEQPTDDDNAENSAVETPTDAADDTADNDEDTGHNGVTADGDEQDGSEERSSNRRRRRGRRGGRRNRVRNRDDAPEGAVDADGNPTESSEEDLAAQSDASKDSASQDHGDDSKPASAKARNIEITTPDDDGTPPVEPQPESTGPGHVDAADTQPEIAADNGDRSVQSQPSDEPTNANGASDAATEQQAEKPPARRNRGEQATSEPRIERITVAPTGAGDDGQASNSDGDGDAQPASANPSADSGTDKPVRRGWWQRKLLGE
ncbi:MAG: Rne/Rng family ribonuclease [Alphaproteobacteria bacterium]|nr:Rne/Rng family ribonuclease [Alphaproteobacteria bacterium]